MQNTTIYSNCALIIGDTVALLSIFATAYLSLMAEWVLR